MLPIQINECYTTNKFVKCSYTSNKNEGWINKSWLNKNNMLVKCSYGSMKNQRLNKTRGSAHWACIAHLTLEWYWSKFQREIIITLKNSSHLEWRVGLSDTILKGTHPGTIYAKFGSIWPSCFRGEDFFNISQSEKRIILGGHVHRPNGTKWRNFIEDLT